MGTAKENKRGRKMNTDRKAIEYCFKLGSLKENKKGGRKMNKEFFKALLFKALLRNSESLEVDLESYVSGEEYMMQKDGGEPDLIHLLALRLLEKMIGRPVSYSIVYQKDYIELVEKRIKKEEEK